MDSNKSVNIKTDTPPKPEKKVPDRLLQKFEDLKKRRLQLCKRSTEKRVKQLQENVIKKVEEEFTKEEDLVALREHDVVLPGSSQRKRKLEEFSSTERRCGESNMSSIDNPSAMAETSGDWKGVQKYLGCNDHLKGLDKGKYTAKTKLHVEIEEAVAKGEFEKAEKLSDDLATREFGTKIAEAFDAKSYTEQKKKEEEIAKAKKKKKLHWGFDHKKRWETKSNM